jgi:hypothetical protein
MKHFHNNKNCPYLTQHCQKNLDDVLRSVNDVMEIRICMYKFKNGWIQTPKNNTKLRTQSILSLEKNQRKDGSMKSIEDRED